MTRSIRRSTSAGASRTASLAVLALSASIAAPAAASGRGPSAGPELGVLRTELVIRPEIAARKLSVEATLFIANPGGRNTFTFLLADWYSSVAVRSLSGPAVFERKDGAIEVRVPRPSREERLVFRLSGSPGTSAGESRPVIDDHSLFLLWSDRFYPVDFDDWSVVQTRVELPASFRVLAPGCRTARIGSDGRWREVFETSEPIRAATILADTRWIESERTSGSRRLRVLLHPASGEFVEHILASSADVLDFYGSRFGSYAFDEFTFATVEGIFARRAIAGGVIYSPAYLDREMRSTGHDAHETALLWWFYTVAGRGPGSYQWIEGFGDYAEVLYDEARGRPIPPNFENFRLGYLQMAGTGEEPSISEPNRGPRWGNYVHGRLPWLMHLLRFAVGDPAFDRSMRLLFDRWRFRSFTLDEFVATLAEGTGRSLDWWRAEWLERGGVPEFAWRGEVARDGSGFRVTVSVRQEGALYHLPLEIGIETEQGLRIERVRLDDRIGEFSFVSSAEPRRILLDPRRWLLAKINRE
jgi:hypothetical protein